MISLDKVISDKNSRDSIIQIMFERKMFKNWFSVIGIAGEENKNYHRTPFKVFERENKVLTLKKKIQTPDDENFSSYSKFSI